MDVAGQSLGAHWDGGGVWFAVRAEHAEAVQVCLFATPEDRHESHRLTLERDAGGVWRGYAADAAPGLAYGLRVHGPYRPEEGHRHNPSKLLVDPYARALAGTVSWSDEVYGFERGKPEVASTADSAPFVPRSLVVDPAFSWGDDRRPATPWGETVLYEAHVKGMTARHPDVPQALRGTYLGLAEDAVVGHLLHLGVTAVELLPVQHSITERRLHAMGLTNYWGYDSLAFFAPDRRFSSLGDPVREFKTLVRRLHRAGLEVILDVVFNHTAEGDHRGPTLSLRGLDNRGHYRLEPGAPERYLNYSGCGNTLDIRKPAALQLVLDCLRYWAGEMHVDGFRFDLAPTLGRDPDGFNAGSPLFKAITEDPLLRQLKWIAEPWDIGPGGYCLGRFPDPWAEWNDRYRDTVRGFWRGDAGKVSELATRLAGSRDLYPRRRHGSIDFVTCHDGFTLRDLVSYEQKHNHGNGEDNRDGHGHNLSRNLGVEGATHDGEILRLRRRLMRSFFATLALSWGVPMLAHGDEIGRTQHGNNNAYCHDDETTWIDWHTRGTDTDLTDFVHRVFELRREAPWAWSQGVPDPPTLGWLHPEGRILSEGDWHDPELAQLGMLLHPPDGPDGALLALLNASGTACTFQLPTPSGGRWRVVLDSSVDHEEEMDEAVARETRVAAHGVRILRWSAAT
ncbi:MAG: glycogen debranching protein GlgX [Acidobacteria bacterium]|nr:glycogen debranching protein GlgX [Acidobacteriota bacterium]